MEKGNWLLTLGALVLMALVISGAVPLVGVILFVAAIVSIAQAFFDSRDERKRKRIKNKRDS